MRSKKEKIIAFCIGTIVVVCSVTFIVTFVRVDLYDPGDMGMNVVTNQMSALVPVSAFVATSTYASTSIVAIVPGVQSIDPSRLIIPALDINAHMQYVGINAKGNIGTPNNFTDVAWYSYGVVPGKSGTAVIDGHVDNGLGLAGVFKHLSSIQIGDEVDVVTKGQERMRFLVTNIETYDYQDVPAQAIFGSSSASSFLNLITCDGTWVQGGDTYNERLIVTAKLVT